MSVIKNNAMKNGQLTPKQENSYNRYFSQAFSDADIDEIIEAGGGQSKENFVSKAKDHIKEKGYWDALINSSVPDKTFKGRDGKTRRSKFQAKYKTLGDAIFKEYIRDLADERVAVREYKRVGKTKTFYTVRKAVSKGFSIPFGKKLYKGGQFLPKKFKIRK